MGCSPSISTKYEIKETFHPNKKLKLRISYLNGKIHGSFEKWDPKGKKECKLNYSHGLKYGLQQRWTSKGGKLTEEYCIRGIEVTNEEFRKYSNEN